MSDAMKSASAFLAELLKRREAYTPDAQKELGVLFRSKERHPPGTFNPSSFLYIRSFDADQGARPFSNTVFWRSPDVTLSPISSVGAYTTELKAGETYLVRVALRNRGDLFVPSAKVELFLTDPSIGFNTAVAERLTQGVGLVPQAFVPALGSAVAEFVWTVPPTQSGHKCLFARVFSLSPLDVPADLQALDQRLDRHVAQQNLNIAGQGQGFAFNFVHQPNALMQLRLRPMAPEELARLRHPAMADLTPARELPRRGWGHLTELKLEGSDADVQVDEGSEGLTLISRGDGLSIDEQNAVMKEVRAVIEAVSAGETKLSQHRDVMERWRKMNARVATSRFVMRTPDLGLAPGEAVAVDITGQDHGLGDETPMGGITLIVTG